MFQKANLLCACLLSAVLPVAAWAQVGAPFAVPVEAPSSSAETTNRPSDYLHAAQSALLAGRLLETQEALEMAQTRMLDRSVPLGQTNIPSDNPVSAQISQARQALAARDRTACMQLIETAIGSATAKGL